MAGRPLQLTEDLVKAAGKLVRSGVVPRRVGRSLGISEHTINRWIQTGGKERRRREAGREVSEKLDIYVDFVLKIESSQNAYVRSLLRKIRVAADDPKNWQAAMALLKSFDPEVFNIDIAKEIRKLWDEIKSLKDGK